ncbi:MAG: hypothetical protein KAY88_04600 [Sediminibacterium sp.]|nr:hypothetical protein [Sediminibacterium sp.]
MKKPASIFYVWVGLCWLIINSCAKDLSYEDGGTPKTAPVAVAGKDQSIVLPKDSAYLDGSGSYDHNGSITTFTWTKLSGPANSITTSASSKTTWIKKLTEGSYVFELTVTNNFKLTAKDTLTVYVDKTKIARPPDAQAGPDQTIQLPINTVTLDGSASSDPDNDISDYLWTRIKGTGNPTYTSPANATTDVTKLTAGQHQFELRVTDATGLVDRDTIAVQVNEAPGVPPIANAGLHQNIPYDLSNCSTNPVIIPLTGTESYDPDGTITKYNWQIIFPVNSSITVANSNKAIASVTGLLAGKYILELSVTDNDGNVKKDTTQLNIIATNRQLIQARLTPVGTLSEKRKVAGVGFVGNKIFLAGGRYQPTGPGPNFTSRVDIYDIATKDWSTSELSQKKWGIATAVAGNKIFFGGGTALQGNAAPTTRVDIYDIVDQKWSTAELPKAGQYTAVAQGNKVLFAGGNSAYSFDYLTEKWSTKTLSQSRVSIAAASVGGSIYFSGGATSAVGGTPFNNIDIYEPKTNSWSVSSMSKAKYALATIGLRGKALWAGGVTDKGLTNEVEILDLLNGKGTTFHCLFQPGSFSTNSMGKLGNYIVFFPDSGDDKTRFDIYDSLNDKWYIGVLDKKIGPAILITAGTELYVVGSSTPGIDYYDQLWKLDF